MQELIEIKRLTQDIIKLIKNVSDENIKPLNEKIDNISVVSDKALQKWGESKEDLEKIKKGIKEAGEFLLKEIKNV